MAEYIKREDAEREALFLSRSDAVRQGGTIKPFKECFVQERIRELPSIDIVYCSECNYCAVVNKDDIYAVCLRYPFVFKLWEKDTRTHYCGFAERKEDNDGQGKGEKV